MFAIFEKKARIVLKTLIYRNELNFKKMVYFVKSTCVIVIAAS